MYNQSNNFPNYGATNTGFTTPGNAGANFDRTLFNQLCDEIMCNIFSINNKIAVLEQAAKNVGTPEYTVMIRDKIHVERQNTKELIVSTTKSIKRLSEIVANANRHHMLHAENILNEFKHVLKRYDALQKQLDPKKEHAVVPAQDIQEEEEDDKAQDVLKKEEREQLEAEFHDLKEITQNFAEMVLPSETIGIVKESTTSTAYNVNGGEREGLLNARNFKAQYLKYFCCSIIVLVLMILIIVTVVLVSFFTI